ncbi:MAG: acetate/propionate family kinase [Chloroflexota bacterium]
MRGRVLVLNAGSSTLKASLVEVDAPGDAPPPLAATIVEWGADASRGADITAGVTRALEQVGIDGATDPALVAVAHRVVHGGSAFTQPTVIDDATLAAIDALASLAPLHNPIAAATIRAARRSLPRIPHVAVFDTAFHATLPETAWRYPVPAGWDDWGIRRYGFHGLSVAWSVERAAQLLDRPAETLGLVVAHLGNGCSVTAVDAGRSVATSMGMTPLEGLMMGTRAGSIDPGIILAILRDQRLDVDALAEVLDHRAGLLAVSGSSSDLRELQAAADGGDAHAVLAIDMFVDRAGAGIAAAATALSALDGVVFTGGIGEHASRVRAAIVDRLSVLGVEAIDPADDGWDGILGGGGGHGPAVLRIGAREDIVAARAALAVTS